MSPPPSLSTATLQSWVNSPSTRGLAAGTVKIYCEPIRAAVTRAWKRGHLTADVAAELDLPERVAAERDAFTLAELDRLLAAADAESRIVILASACAGLRLGDATSLTWREVDLARGLIQLDQGNTGKGVVIPIHPRLRAEIEPLAGDDPDAPLTSGLIGRDSAAEYMAKVIAESQATERSVLCPGAGGRPVEGLLALAASVGSGCRRAAPGRCHAGLRRVPPHRA